MRSNVHAGMPLYACVGCGTRVWRRMLDGWACSRCPSPWCAEPEMAVEVMAALPARPARETPVHPSLADAATVEETRRAFLTALQTLPVAVAR
jgi:hypothetical protein